MLEEYGDVLGDRPDFVAEVVDSCRVCYSLTMFSNRAGYFRETADERVPRWRK